MLKPQSAGGKASAIIQRQKSLEDYYNKPNYCLFCNKLISVPWQSKVAEIKKKKFCNRSCAASFNNSLNPKRKSKQLSTTFCTRCNCSITLSPKKDGGFNNRKLCDLCLSLNRAETLTGNKGIENLLLSQTKGSLYKRRKNWQSANSTLRRDSRQVYAGSGFLLVCKICAYDKYVEICHIKPVKDFSDDAKISEINNITNLVALCPNHHWEFDNGFRKI